MWFWEKKHSGVTVFLSRREELLSMAGKLLTAADIPFERSQVNQIDLVSVDTLQQIKVANRFQERARLVLRSLTELDSIICGR